MSLRTDPSSAAVDVVIPSHGRPEFLRATVESVLHQSVTPASVWVVSDDEHPEVSTVVDTMKIRESTFPIHFLSRTDRAGASLSRNLGAKRGSASFIAFLDDDDLWEPTYLEEALQALERSGADIVVTGIERFSVRGVSGVMVPDGNLRPKDVFMNSPRVTGSSIVCRRSAFTTLGGFDVSLPVANDRDFFLRALESGMTYVVNPSPLVRVRSHTQGQLTNPTHLRAAGIATFLRKHKTKYTYLESRNLRYTSARTYLSVSSSMPHKARWFAASLFSWSPSAGRQIPLIPSRR
ncbi:glycosyltransferase family 2 protein [Kocuria flava]|nr:glycosyltransferase family 2 protein [Kocuria flava]